VIVDTTDSHFQPSKIPPSCNRKPVEDTKNLNRTTSVGKRTLPVPVVQSASPEVFRYQRKIPPNALTHVSGLSRFRQDSCQSSLSATGLKTRLNDSQNLRFTDCDTESGYEDTVHSTELLAQEWSTRNGRLSVLPTQQDLSLVRDASYASSVSLNNLPVQSFPLELTLLSSGDKSFDMSVRHQNTASLTDLSGHSRRCSIQIEHPVSIVFLNDHGSLEHVNREHRDTLNTSLDVIDWMSDFDGSTNAVNIPVVLDDEDDKSLASEYLRSAHDQTHSQSSEVIWSPDDLTAEMLEHNSKYDMEVIEHEATRMSTMLVPNTALDSDSSENEDVNESTMDNIRSVFDDAVSCHSGITEPDPYQSTLSVRESGTQTLRNRTTQTDVERETQTDTQTTPVAQITMSSTSRLDIPSLGYPLQLAENRFAECRHESTDRNKRLTPTTSNFSQQTPVHNATQTPVLLRLSARGNTNLSDGSMLFSNGNDDYDFDQHLFQQTLSNVEDNVPNQMSFKSFGTQTFGQMTNNDTITVQTQTFPDEWPAVDIVVAYESEEEELPEYLPEVQDGIDVVEYDLSTRRSSDGPRRHRHKEKKVKRDTQSKRDDQQSEISSVESTSSCKKNLLKLMIHQVKSLKEQFKNNEAIHKPEMEKHLHKHSHRHSHRRGHKDRSGRRILPENDDERKHSEKSAQSTRHRNTIHRAHSVDSYNRQPIDSPLPIRRAIAPPPSWRQPNKTSDFASKYRSFPESPLKTNDLRGQPLRDDLIEYSGMYGSQTDRYPEYRFSTRNPRLQGSTNQSRPRQNHPVHDQNLQQPLMDTQQILQQQHLHQQQQLQLLQQQQQQHQVHGLNQSPGHSAFRPISDLSSMSKSPIYFIPEISGSSANPSNQSYIVVATSQAVAEPRQTPRSLPILSDQKEAARRRKVISHCADEMLLRASLSKAEDASDDMKHLTASLKKRGPKPR